MSFVKGILELVVVTPTLQIVDSESADGGTLKIKTRKLPVFLMDEKGNSYIVKETAALSSESLRGISRRRLASATMNEIIKNSSGKKFNPRTVHLFIDGGLTNVNNILTYEKEQEIREKFPFFSVFGAGLSLSGKLVIQDAIPIVNVNSEWTYVTNVSTDKIPEYANFFNGKYSSAFFVASTFNGQKDDILSHSSYIFQFLTEEDVAEWEEQAIKNSQDRRTSVQEQKDKKNNKQGKKDDAPKDVPKDKDKKMTTQGIRSTEFIVPGTRLRTEISVFEDVALSDAEKGCVALAALEIAKQRRIGANQRMNWGIYNAFLDLEVDNTKSSAYRTVNKSNFLLHTEDTQDYLNKLSGYVDAYWESVKKLTVDDVEELRANLEKNKENGVKEEE